MEKQYEKTILKKDPVNHKPMKLKTIQGAAKLGVELANNLHDPTLTEVMVKSATRPTVEVAIKAGYSRDMIEASIRTGMEKGKKK